MPLRRDSEGPSVAPDAAVPQAPRSLRGPATELHGLNSSHGTGVPRFLRGGQGDDRPPAGSTGSYRERLLVPLGYWLIAIPVVVTLGAEAYFFVDGFIPPLVIVALYLIVAVFLVNWSAATIEVTGSVLRAGKDTLALSEAAEVIALDEKQAMALRGPRADPSAHILLRPYLKRAVYIALANPTDGVPYWLVATRHPEELAGAIEGSRQERSSSSSARGSGGQAGNDGAGSQAHQQSMG